MCGSPLSPLSYSELPACFPSCCPPYGNSRALYRAGDAVFAPPAVVPRRSPAFWRSGRFHRTLWRLFALISFVRGLRTVNLNFQAPQRAAVGRFSIFCRHTAPRIDHFGFFRPLRNFRRSFRTRSRTLPAPCAHRRRRDVLSAEFCPFRSIGAAIRHVRRSPANRSCLRGCSRSSLPGKRDVERYPRNIHLTVSCAAHTVDGRAAFVRSRPEQARRREHASRLTGK